MSFLRLSGILVLLVCLSILPQAQEAAAKAADPELNVENFSAGYDNGFFISFEKLKFKLKGYTRQHAYFFENHTVQDNTYSATEARLDFWVTYKDWQARMRTEFGSLLGNPTVVEAYMEYLGVPAFKPRLGAYIIPFSSYLQTPPEEYMAAMLPPYLSTILGNTGSLVPWRDVGLGVYGDISPYVSYAGGVYNGDGLNNGNFNDDVLVTGELRYYPLTNQEKTVYLQVGGFLNYTDFREEGARITLPALRNHQVFAPGGEDIDDTNGRIIGATAGMRYWRDELRIECELMWVRAQREADGANILVSRTELDMWGFSAGISYFFLIGDEKKRGGLEPLFRVSYTDIDDAHGDGSAGFLPLGTPTDIRGQNIWEIVLGVQAHLNKNVRADFNWYMYDLERTEGTLAAPLNNNERGTGGGLLHAFVFQFQVKW